MSGGWKGSNRKAELPVDWPARRKECFDRDGWRCTYLLPNGSRCPARATDCDHVGPKWDHRLENLTSLCSDHHDEKSAQQGVEARAARRNARKRPAEVDPRTIV